MSTVHRIISIALAKFSDCLLLEGGGGGVRSVRSYEDPKLGSYA